MSESSDKGETSEESAEVNSESFVFSDLPVRGGPDQLLTAIGELKEGGARNVSDLHDEIDEYGRTNLSGNIKLGELLGFIERSGEGVALTDRGFQLAFAAEDGEELSEYFREGIESADLYLSILESLSQDDDYDSLINNTEVLEILRIEFNMREADATKLKRGISILFDCMEEAGYGERKGSSGEYPVRFSFADEWTLRSMLGELIQEKDRQDGKAEEKIETDESEGEIESESQDGTQSTSLEDSREENQGDQIEDSALEAANSSTQKNDDENQVESEMEVEDKQDNKVDISISIDIDANSMDTAEFERKISAIDEFLNE